MKHEFIPSGVCSTKVEFEINDGKVENIVFYNGCNGNLKGIAALCDGQTPEWITGRLRGITCGFKNTSCPDQFCRALDAASEMEGAGDNE